MRDYKALSNQKAQMPDLKTIQQDIIAADTMNDRGLSLNSAEMMKAYVMQQIVEADRALVNHRWQDNINRINSIICMKKSKCYNAGVKMSLVSTGLYVVCMFWNLL